MALILVVTDAGRAAIVAAGGGTAAVTITECGLSETAIVADPADIALTDEFGRVTSIAGAPLNPDQMHMTVQDTSIADYQLRSFALYLDDGTLFALYSQADPILVKTPESILLLAVDVAFIDIDATTITFGDATFGNPPATEAQQGVVELATDAETAAGTDATRAVTPHALDTAMTGVRHVVASSLVANGGYIKHGDGLIECWGYVDVADDSYGYFNLPVTHTSWVVPAIACADDPGNTGVAEPVGFAAIIGAPPTQIKLWNGQNSSRRVYVRTIGM